MTGKKKLLIGLGVAGVGVVGFFGWRVFRARRVENTVRLAQTVAAKDAAEAAEMQEIACMLADRLNNEWIGWAGKHAAAREAIQVAHGEAAGYCAASPAVTFSQAKLAYWADLLAAITKNNGDAVIAVIERHAPSNGQAGFRGWWMR
jgi:prophage DNA circulation protein